MLVENVFNVHGLLASILGAAIWAFTILYHSSDSAAAAPQVTVRIVCGPTYVVRYVAIIAWCIFRLTWCATW